MAARSVLGVVVALVLCVFLLASAFEAFPEQPGADFYQFWGVPTAKRMMAAHDAFESPYVSAEEYAENLNHLSDRYGSRKLRSANALRRTLEPMGTPFLYATFSLFPEDYDSAQAIFVTLLYLGAGVGVFALARLRGLSFHWAACVAFAVELTFAPFMVDVRAANVNSLQLALIAVLVWMAAKNVRTGNAFVDALFLGVLAPLVIFKPNTLWIAAALALQYGLSRGARQFLGGVGMAAALSIISIAIGSAYLGTSSWTEWLGLAGRMQAGLPLSLEEGNESIAMWLSRHGGAYGAVGYGAILGLLLLLVLALAMSANGKRSDLLWPTAKRAFCDPWFAASVGVLLTFATSPLVWSHYFVLALVPIAWLLGRDGMTGVGTWGAAICYLALARGTIDVLVSGGHMAALYAMTMLSWIALVPGMLAYAAQQRLTVEVAK
jgi:hypothetical protein